jgi:hypothetical protein
MYMESESIAIVYLAAEPEGAAALVSALTTQQLTSTSFTYEALKARNARGLPDEVNCCNLAFFVLTHDPGSGAYDPLLLQEIKDLIHVIPAPAFPLWLNAGQTVEVTAEEKPGNALSDVFLLTLKTADLTEFTELITKFIREFPTNPFKGPEPYTRNDELFGREEDVKVLVDLIRNNTLTLLYSQSGYGKSSLLQSRLIPQLERTRTFFPVYISMRNINRLTVGVLKDCIGKNLSNLTTAGVQIKTSPAAEQSSFILEYLYDIDIRAEFGDEKYALSPVLIFDQFEELFTNRTIDIEKMVDEFSYILDKKLPPDMVKALLPAGQQSARKDSYRNLVERITGRDIPYRVLFAFRQEYLISLDEFRDQIPSITYTNGKYRLDSFSRVEAEAIIMQVAGKVMDSEEISHIARILADVCRPMTAEAGETDNNRCISPFIMSLVCRELYYNIVAKNILKPFLPERFHIMEEATLHSMIDNVKENYYLKCFGGLNTFTSIFVEEKLISNEGKRTLFPYEDIRNFFDGTEPYFKGKDRETLDRANASLQEDVRRLIDDSRIRYLNINSYLNTPNVEILHDQLAIPVRSRRIQRQAKEDLERKLAMEAEFQQRQADTLKTENTRLSLEWQRRKTKTRGLFIWAFIGLFLVSTVIFFQLLSNSVAVMMDFTVNEEQNSLKYLERFNGTYAAFLESYKYYNSLKDGILPYSRILLFSRNRHLTDTVERMVRLAFQKEPFYGLVSIPRPEGTTDIRLSGRTGVLFSLKGDSLYARDPKTFQEFLLHLRGYRDSVQLGDYSSHHAGVGFWSPTDNWTLPNYLSLRRHTPSLLIGSRKVLALNNDTLYLLSNSATPEILNSFKLNLPSVGYVFAPKYSALDLNPRLVNYIQTDSLVISLSFDEHLAIIKTKFNSPSGNPYYWLLNTENSHRHPEPISLKAGQTLINIVTDTASHEKIVYTKNETDERKKGKRNITSNVTNLCRYRFVGGRFRDTALLAANRVLLSPAENESRQDSASLFRQTSSGRWCLKLNHKKWQIYDLASADTSHVLVIDTAGGQPREIIAAHGDILIIRDGLNMELQDKHGVRRLTDLRIIDTAEHAYTHYAGGLGFVSATPTNSKSWYTFLIGNDFGADKLAVLNVDSSTLRICTYYFSGDAGDFYKFPDNRLAFMPQDRYDYLRSKTTLLYWLVRPKFDKTPSITQLKTWMSEMQTQSDTTFQHILIKSFGEN